jgi:hypothetical protein
MKRRLDIIAIFLLAGAVVNVTVAWGHAAWVPPKYSNILDRSKSNPGARLPPTLTYTGPAILYLANDACGWPARSFACTTVIYYTVPIEPMEVPGRGRAEAGRSPVYPIWSGFVINTVFYAATLWALWLLYYFRAALWRLNPIPNMRGNRRLRRGLCPTCAYPIGESAVCTECGSDLPGYIFLPTSTVTEADVKDFLEVIGRWGPCD